MTPKRVARIRAMLAHRQPDLTLCLEEVHKPHNLAAIVRTADAVGVSDIHAVWPTERMRLGGGTAMGSQQWVKLHMHDQVAEAIESLKAQGMQILATNLSETAVDFREIDYTKPTAVILGQEKFGITPEALAMADQDIVIPMVGMVQSLNVSVAAATILYEAQRQREAAGMYTKGCQLPESEVDRLLFEGGHPNLAKRAYEKGLAVPKVDDEGNIIADQQWWSVMREA